MVWTTVLCRAVINDCQSGHGQGNLHQVHHKPITAQSEAAFTLASYELRLA